MIILSGYEDTNSLLYTSNALRLSSKLGTDATTKGRSVGFCISFATGEGFVLSHSDRNRYPRHPFK